MKDLKGKTVVVTGGAGGIGNAMARNFAAAGARLVIGDIEEETLAAAVVELESDGAEAIGVPTDVSDVVQVEALRDAALDKFGAVHVVCNNAGVGTGGPLWHTTVEDWKWVLGVNLWGVIHGILTFVPLMVEQGEGHVVNTASMAGLVSGPGLGIYSASKFAVVATSESLLQDLKMAGSPVGVSVLCPGWVRTQIANSERNRPNDLARSLEPDRVGEVMLEMVRQVVDNGIEPEIVGQMVVDAVRENQFYIFPHPQMLAGATSRVERLVAGLAPEVSMEILGG